MPFENMSNEVAKGILEHLLIHAIKRDATIYDLLSEAEDISPDYKKQALEVYQSALKVAITFLERDIANQQNIVGR